MPQKREIKASCPIFIAKTWVVGLLLAVSLPITGLIFAEISASEENIPPISEPARKLIWLPQEIGGSSLNPWIKLLGKPRNHRIEKYKTRYSDYYGPDARYHSLTWGNAEIKMSEIGDGRFLLEQMLLSAPSKAFQMPIRWGMSPKEVILILGPPQNECDDLHIKLYLRRERKESELVFEYGDVSKSPGEGVLVIFNNQHLDALVWQYGID